MTEPASAPRPGAALPSDLSRLVRRVLADATVPDALAHDGDCGPKARCPNQPPDEPYRLLELRPDRAVLAFCRCHHGRHDPGDPDHAALSSAFGEALP